MKTSFQQILYHWFTTLPGQVILEQEKKLIDSAINNLFGYLAVQIGAPSNEGLMSASRIKFKLLITQTKALSVNDEHCYFVHADMDCLPIDKNIVDLVVLAHSLEGVSDPYHLLRQVDAMLVSEGHVLITGFNPMGCLVMHQRWFSRKSAIKSSKLEMLNQVKGWLKVLGYEVQVEKYSQASCFARAKSIPNRVCLIEYIEKYLTKMGFSFGNIYCLVAKKRVYSPTFVGQKWRLLQWKELAKQGSVPSTRVQRKNH